MFDTILVANRGVIAGRIIRTLNAMNIRSIAVYHQEDFQADYVRAATQAVCLGDGSVADTYLNAGLILQIAEVQGAQAIHPGYGFLSENVAFAQACEAQGIAFIGPTPEQIEGFGLKHEARRLAEAAGVPCIPGSPLLNNLSEAQIWATELGFPVMLKSTAGGGGIGMQVCHAADELESAWDTVRQLGESFFANAGVFVEKYVDHARHIEIQAFGDGAGTVVTLGERDCSAQRRNQKVIEETPAPNLRDSIRDEMAATAERLLTQVNYRNAGTVEFIYDTDTEAFYFLEVNTRLQVEHGVTEEVWGVDLVECMVRQTAGAMTPLQAWRETLRPQGHAIQVRVYAEDPGRDFLPSPGLISDLHWPQGHGLRLETWAAAGCTVPALFDPMIAKVIQRAEDRDTCLAELTQHLEQAHIYGVETNIDYAASVLTAPLFQSGALLTRSLADHAFAPAVIKVLSPGTQTTVQDGGRPGYWHVGVPPSGPMDRASFELANQLVGNVASAAALEITVTGPTLKIEVDTVIAIVGADIEAQLDGEAVPLWAPVSIHAGQTLSLGKIHGFGARCYLAFAQGIDCPSVLGSQSTFVLGQFGGHVGRALRTGDVLRLQSGQGAHTEAGLDDALVRHAEVFKAAQETDTWTLQVVYGPHGAPEYFDADFIDTFFDARWEVHYNSSRTGIRLLGPQPKWTRDTGGEAGLHPSNIHDNAYAFGSVDFTGDMPVILGPDGPSLGGFVCPATVVHADLWKLGQLKAGVGVRFQPVAAEQSEREANQSHPPASPIVLHTRLEQDDVVVRLAGDHFVLIELGPMELDIARRLRVQRLLLWLQTHPLDGMQELTPGVRSLQVHYDPGKLPLNRLLQHVEQACDECQQDEHAVVPSRIVHLPLSWDDDVCQQAADRYTQSVWPGAPWCPSNLEFIRRINGLESIDDVKRIIFDASYLVLGLGDVYLGAPLATPLNPCHRLVTTKYNPARTWTAENSVGIGGAYLCIYGMEGPGGYQLFGRTVQMWNRYRQTPEFQQPWLLRFFDQIRFFEVPAEELLDIRQQFELGMYPLRIEETQFDLAEYQAGLVRDGAEIQTFSQRRGAAFQAEMQRWRATGDDVFQENHEAAADTATELADGQLPVDSNIDGSVWELVVQEGDVVELGQTVCLVESMKMEVPVTAPAAGKVVEIFVSKGASVRAGQTLMAIEEVTNSEIAADAAAAAQEARS